MVIKLTPQQLEWLQEYSRVKGDILFESDDFDPFDHSGLYKSDDINPEPTGLPLLRINVKGNAKIKHPYFSLPSGYSCPGAKLCLSKADKETGKIGDGEFTKFRCYSASDESRYPQLRKQVWTNFELLRGCKSSKDMADLIVLSIIKQIPLLPKVFRIHEGGDFFNQKYFDAWIMVAAQLPEVKFYAYTKALNFWIKRISQIPPNLILTASFGSKYDHLIHEYNLKYVEVVFSTEEAKEKRLPIDKDDRLAWDYDGPFALLLHGVQPKGSDAADAMKKLKSQGHTGYTSKKKLNEQFEEGLENKAHFPQEKTFFPALFKYVFKNQYDDSEDLLEKVRRYFGDRGANVDFIWEVKRWPTKGGEPLPCFVNKFLVRHYSSYTRQWYDTVRYVLSEKEPVTDFDKVVHHALPQLFIKDVATYQKEEQTEKAAKYLYSFQIA